MEVKKAIKKVVALGIGAAMVGTTIMGAMAASLADYPKPFVQDGKFNGYIVLGDNAKVLMRYSFCLFVKAVTMSADLAGFLMKQFQ